MLCIDQELSKTFFSFLQATVFIFGCKIPIRLIAIRQTTKYYQTHLCPKTFFAFLTTSIYTHASTHIDSHQWKCSLLLKKNCLICRVNNFKTSKAANTLYYEGGLLIATRTNFIMKFIFHLCISFSL